MTFLQRSAKIYQANSRKKVGIKLYQPKLYWRWKSTKQNKEWHFLWIKGRIYNKISVQDSRTPMYQFKIGKNAKDNQQIRTILFVFNTSL